MGGRTLDLRRGLWYNTAMEVCDVVIAATRPALRRGPRLGLLLLAAVLACSATGRAQAPARPGVVMVPSPGGYQDAVVRRASPDRVSLAEQTVVELGARSGAFDTSRLYSREDLERLSADAFAEVRAVLFYTTGSLPLRPEARPALLRFGQRGGGFGGVHCAPDTRYEGPEYGELVGAYFDGHPWTQRVRLVVEDPSHPSTKHLGPGLEITDEIYQFRNWSRDKVHVLLKLDPRSGDARKGKRARPDHRT